MTDYKKISKRMFGMNWLNVFPVKLTPEEKAELERQQQEWRDRLFDDWD